jgi:hypothetical protein
MLSLRNLAAVIASTTLFIFLSLVAVAADTSAMAKASYLPDELMQLPPKVKITADLSGYWAGMDAPLIRCIKLERHWESFDELNNGPISLEIAEGLTIDYGYSKDLLAFYYLDDSGLWKRIGSFGYNWISDIEPVENPYDEAERSILRASIGNSGNARSQKGVCCFVFHQLPDGSVTFHDMAPSLEGMNPIEIYGYWMSDSLVFAVYPTIATEWEVGFEGFAHAGSPDRYILLSVQMDGTITNVSKENQSFYLEHLGHSNLIELQESAVLGRPVKKPAKDDYYLSEIIQLLIDYHDMGYSDEGVRLARRLVKAYGYEYYFGGETAYQLIDDTIAKLQVQDKLIQDVIDKHNAELSAAAW